MNAGPASRLCETKRSGNGSRRRKNEGRTESANGIDDLVERVPTDLDESGLEGGLLTEERAGSIDLDVSNRSEMTISTRSDDGGGLGSSHHPDGGSSRSNRHSERSEGLTLSGELNRSLEGDDGRRTKKYGRSSASGVEEVVDVDFGVSGVEAFDRAVDEAELTFRDEFVKVGRTRRRSDEIDPVGLGRDGGEGDRVVGGGCSRHGDIVRESRGDDGCGGDGGDEDEGGDEGGEHCKEKTRVE